MDNDEFWPDGDYPPVEVLLGTEAFKVVKTANVASCCLIRWEAGSGSKNTGLEGYRRRIDGPHLSAAQLNSLREILLEPRAYYNGHPIFRRRPPSPELAIRLVTSQGKWLDVMIDLHNPGWEFYFREPCLLCGWNWVGKRLVALSKELFPQFASPNSKSVWKKDAFRNAVIQLT